MTGALGSALADALPAFPAPAGSVPATAKKAGGKDRKFLLFDQSRWRHGQIPQWLTRACDGPQGWTTSGGSSLPSSSTRSGSSLFKCERATGVADSFNNLS